MPGRVLPEVNRMVQTTIKGVISALRAKLAPSMVDDTAAAKVDKARPEGAPEVHGSVPKGIVSNIAAAPIGNGGHAAVVVYRPSKYAGKAPDGGGYTPRFYSLALADAGVSPAKCQLPDAVTLAGFAGGGWQFVCQLASRRGNAVDTQATAWGVYVANATGAAPMLVAVGIADTPDIAKARCRGRANTLLGARFTIEPVGNGQPSSFDGAASAEANADAVNDPRIDDGGDSC